VRIKIFFVWAAVIVRKAKQILEKIISSIISRRAGNCGGAYNCANAIKDPKIKGGKKI
jgi:hypothetical protein